MLPRVTHPLVLGIETSCDDTACAVLDGAGAGAVVGGVEPELAAHRPYGGVVPEIASREHLANWSAVSEEALAQAGVSLREVEVVAATRGPGLVGALLRGALIGKAIAFAAGRPFHAVHHLEGHLYSPSCGRPGSRSPRAAAEPLPRPRARRGPQLPLRGRGRRRLHPRRDPGRRHRRGLRQGGERLGLPYPQGPKVDDGARHRGPAFPVSRFGETLDFSYSGLRARPCWRSRAIRNRTK